MTLMVCTTSRDLTSSASKDPISHVVRSSFSCSLAVSGVQQSEPTEPESAGVRMRGLTDLLHFDRIVVVCGHLIAPRPQPHKLQGQQNPNVEDMPYKDLSGALPLLCLGRNTGSYNGQICGSRTTSTRWRISQTSVLCNFSLF